MQYYFNGEDIATYRWDLGSRVDGQPLYSGRFENPPENLTAVQLEETALWVVHYYEYTTVGSMDILTSKKMAAGKWSNRDSLTYR